MMTSPGTLVIRAEADPQTGTGHFMRCLALAQQWRDRRGRVVLVTACSFEGLLSRYRREGATIVSLERCRSHSRDAEMTAQVMREIAGSWLILDGCQFSEDYQRQIKIRGHRLLVIDDSASLPHYYADIILNQNYHAGFLHYSAEPCTKLLLGTKYSLVRRELFIRKRRAVSQRGRSRVLVSLGGADPENATLAIMQSFKRSLLNNFEFKIVVGVLNPNLRALRRAAQENSIRIKLKSDVKNMAALMRWAEIAIIAPGITLWELFHNGCPVICYFRDPSQKALLCALRKRGALKLLGGLNDIDERRLTSTLRELGSDPMARRRMRDLGRTIVDGNGSRRVVDLLIAATKSGPRLSNMRAN